MKVTVVRSGGFAGITRRATADTAALPKAAGGEIESLVGQVDWAALARPGAARSPGADRFTYRIVTEGGPADREVVVGEAALPDALRRCIELVFAHGG
jgi:hypothetical protein